MIKKTLYFGNPAYLGLRQAQLAIRQPEALDPKREKERTIPVEDIGVVVLDHQQITITHGALCALSEANVAVITCGQDHMPLSLQLNLHGHHVQQEIFRHQLDSSLPLRKNLCMQLTQAKIRNQAAVLRQQGTPAEGLLALAREVRSGDPDNNEAQAAAVYWKRIFPEGLDFFRHREGKPPNNLLNYGYAILRAVVGRSLVASGLLPTLGIHHHNRYNAYCLADDMMEPYRPSVDALVAALVREGGRDLSVLSTDLKGHLLKVPTLDVMMDGERSPLMVAVQRTTASLARCFQEQEKRLMLPTLPDAGP
ncbi:MAG: type II CRISPR-associated endonuclease Cas1 [Flavobacteriales bacterium]|nr:type II CRISPR-associated endonuclease Cas1 [Flavobacteriales bacterium]